MEARTKMVNEFHSRSVPVIVVDNEVILGFDRGRLEGLLSS